MDPVKRKYYSYELKNEVIQMIKSGVKRSEVIKKYDIHSGLLSKWIINSDTIVAKANGKIEKAKLNNFPEKDARVKKLVHKSISVDPTSVENVAGNSHVISMDALDKELMSKLSELTELNEGKDDHPSVQWLFKWFSVPGRTANEFFYVVRDMRDKVTNYDEDKAIYILRAAAEALAVRCPVLEGRWYDVAWTITYNLGEWRYKSYGQGSSRLSNWIIRVVGDPKLCPSSSLRLQMLLLYRTLVKFDSNNRTKALEAMMFTFSSLDRKEQKDFIDIKTDNIIDCMTLFGRTRTTYPFSKYADRVAKLLEDPRNNSHENGKGTSPPKQVQGLLAILKYISNAAPYHRSFNHGRDGSRTPSSE